MTARGGPQIIPRPLGAQPGGPAPWAVLPEPDRVVKAADLRAAFSGRVGAPALVEGSPDKRPSAVLAAFYEQDGELYVVLTRRAWSLRAHTGEVSFPGGGADEGEPLRTTALREAHEEVGLDPASVEVLGELDHLTTVTSRSFIVPFVALLSGRPALRPNPAEVDAVLHVPVRELLLDEVFHEERWSWADRDLQLFFFELVGDTVWGATAAMLRHLLALALRLEVGIDHA